MKLSDLEALAKARTAGKWSADFDQVIIDERGGGFSMIPCMPKDAAFIAAAAAHFEALLAVVRHARNLVIHPHLVEGTNTELEQNLEKALERLEAL